MVRFLSVTTVLLVCSTGFAGDPPGGGGSGANALTLYPRVNMETTLGSFVLELNGEKAPATVMNFIWYAEDGYYNGTIFHRVARNKLIQGGGYLPNLDRKLEGLRPGIPSEWENGLKNKKWTITMSRRYGWANTATSMFHINTQDNQTFDIPSDGAAYAVFGKVVEGIQTVEKIRDTKTSTNAKYGGSATTVPAEPVVIKSVTVTSAFDRAKLEGIARKAIAELRQERKLATERNKLELAEVIKIIEEEAGATLVTTDSGLMYVDMKVGDGPSPMPTDTVSVHHKGWITDGTEFQNSYSRDTPVSFRLIDILPAWIESLQTMKAGGKRRLIVPPELGYGPLGKAGRAPPTYILIFEIELLGVEKDEEKPS